METTTDYSYLAEGPFGHDRDAAEDREVTITLVVKVTVSEQALLRHVGGDDRDPRVVPELVLFEHVRSPIEDPCFDTPATLSVISRYY
jgi:hypothetical protein